MYLCQSRLDPGVYQVTSYASAARVLCGYMVCARAHVTWLHGLHACCMVTWFACVAWLHGLRDGQRPPQGAGEILSAKTHIPHVCT